MAEIQQFQLVYNCPSLQHLSLLIIIIASVLALLHVVSYAFFWLSVSGTLSGWIYLRFYQKREQGSRGDMAESFSFATFFPEMIQYVAA